MKTPHVRERRVVTVGEDNIIAAMRLVWERAKLVIEPSAAVAVAAVLAPDFRAPDGPRKINRAVRFPSRKGARTLQRITVE